MYIESQLLSSETTSSSTESWNAGRTDTAPDADEQQLLESHLHLVQNAVRSLKRRVPAQIDADDLYSVGVSGLMTAVRKYDRQQHRTFAAFASLRIRGAMLDELRRLDPCSRRTRTRARHLKEATDALEQKLGRPATPEEVRQSLGLGHRDFAKWTNAAQPVRVLALDHRAGVEEDGASLHELIADTQDETGAESMEKAELIELLVRRIAELPSQQQKVLAMFYYEGMRVAEIAAVFGVTPSRISQIHSRCLTQLRTWLKTARDR